MASNPHLCGGWRPFSRSGRVTRRDSPRFILNRRLGGSQNSSNHGGEEENKFSPHPSVCQYVNLTCVVIIGAQTLCWGNGADARSTDDTVTQDRLVMTSSN